MDKNKSFLDNFILPEYPTRIFRLQRGWERLVKLGEHVYYPKNYILVSPGDTIQYCYLVIKGRVISEEYTPDGTEHIFNIFEKGSIFLESNLLLNVPSAVNFQTLIPSELICITQAKLSDAMAADYEMVKFVLESMANKYYSAMDQLRENYNHDAKWKVYNLLLILAANFGIRRDNWIMINFKVSQQMLSNLLGINRITIGKIIRELKELQLIEQVNGYYCIHNIENVRQYQPRIDTVGK